MELNQTTLAGILARILSVDQKYVVPKQGNWWNPQASNKNIENWCAFQIKQNKPRTAPFYNTSDDGTTNAVAVSKIADIALQFVGPQSEEIANSVSMWPFRADVKQELQQVHGALLYDDMTAVGSIFAQDGNNTILAWNVNIRVNWIHLMETNQGSMPEIQLNSKKEL